MKFIAVSFVFAITVSVVISQGFNIPYGYRLVPINSYYPSAPAPLAPLAPLAVTPAAGPYKSESFSTPSLSKSEIRDDSGQYALSYVTADGIRVSERSYLKPSKEGYVPVKEGTYEYTSPDGTPVSFGYKADENGYVVKGYPLPLGPVPVAAKA